MGLTQNDLMKIQEKIKEAEADNTPFMVVDGEGGLNVVGDVNKTEPKYYDYTVKFRLPIQYKDLLPGSEEAFGGKYCVAEVDYKNVTISARKDLKIVTALMGMLPFLREILPDGDARDRSKDELSDIVANAMTNDEVVSAMYDFVSVMLDIDPMLKDMMLYSSVFSNVLKMMTDFPEILNESDFFTGQWPLEKEDSEK